MAENTNLRQNSKARVSIGILITAAVLVIVMGTVQYWFASSGIKAEVEEHARGELRVKSLEIKNVMTAAEVAVENMVWVVEQNLDKPDSMYSITRRLLSDNDGVIVGSAVGFEPYYYREKGRQYSPYSYENGDEIIDKQLGTDKYDYHEMEWYTETMRTGQGHWSEPYFDENGGEMMMTTFSYPVHDKKGKRVAVLTADLSLEWLSDVINKRRAFPSSFNVVISRNGLIIVSPVDSLILKYNAHSFATKNNDTVMQRVTKAMIDGSSGMATVKDPKGKKNYIYYSPIDGNTGWSMAVICSDQDIFQNLRQRNFILILLMIGGLSLLVFIISRSLNTFVKLQNVNAEKERIGSELLIASNIQKGMLPKIFPPFPDRDDIDIYGSLKAAKEIGGDLYDFFIRDEKLFFCIGDVSGKGVPASLVMAVTRSLFRTVSAHEASPERIMEQMNDAMAEMNESNMFVTLFVGVLDLLTGQMRYSNAGHCPPMMVDGNDVELLQMDSNVPLGLMMKWKYTVQEAMIAPQTTLFLYTDGLTEAENSAHELFGEERMIDTGRKNSDAESSEDLLSAMNDAVRAFVDGNEQSDDLTMLALRFTKNQAVIKLQRSLILPNDVNAVPQLASFVDDVCEQLDIDPSTNMSLNLALEEAVVNVMKYAYPEGTKGEVHIDAKASDKRLRITITDSGIPFDPTAQREADTSLSVEERPIGGLGIYLVRQLMDSINYNRVDGKNVLTLLKKLG